MFPMLFGTFGSRRSNAAADRSGPTEGTAHDAAPVRRDVLSLEKVRLVIEDGLLMVLGPEGDPVPPEAFRAAASAMPGALLSLEAGEEVSAEKALAVLEAQTKGTLVAGEKEDGWILAMLGVGPRPEMTSAEQLQAETDTETTDPGPESRPSEKSAQKAPGGGVVSIPLAVVPPCPEGLEPGQATVIILSGLPDGSVLTAGSDEGHGRWLLSPADLDGLVLRLPDCGQEKFTIKVTTIALIGQSGALASAQADLSVDCKPGSSLPEDGPVFPGPATDRKPQGPVSAPPSDASQSPVSTRRSAGIDLAPELLADPANEVLVLRGIPADVSLSAGLYDGSIGGWVLRPAEASGLRIEAVSEVSRPQFTIAVLGISLKADGPRQARELVRIPIALD